MKISADFYRYSASLLVSLILYILLLLSPLSYSFTSFFWVYSPLLFFLVFTLYALNFQLKGYSGWIAGLCLTMALFALSLSFMWHSGYSDNKIIGGLVPYRDAYHYYNGAHLILDGHLLTENSVQAAGRPLFPGFIASLLLLTGKNLQASTAILVGLLGFTSYLSAQKIRASFGSLAAALYLSFSFVYAQSQIGYLHTELLGLILGNLGFVLIWQSAEKRNLIEFIFAIFILMLAISARAGAFFIFPMLALWAGWAFREKTRFSWRSFGIISLVIIFSYLSVNTLYAHLVVEPGNHSFGNFAYTFYGQVHGGTGWNRAIKDLATRDPAIIMDSAIQFFRAHPLSLLIGTAKAYRDFFIPNGNGIFSFHGSKTIWLDSSLWIASIILLFFGLFRAIKKFKDPIISLLLASFIGIFLSIPFLPPIDGGKRFYASTMPFFFALIALALPSIEIKKKIWIEDRKTGTALLSGLLALMTLIMPVTIIQLTSPPEITPASCPADQEPFAFHHDPNSYIDLIPSEETPCGQAPSVCFDVFLQNATERKYNLFFEELIKEAELQNGTTRILTTNNLVQRGSAYFFIGSTTLLSSIPAGEIISGCATPLPTKGYPTIYRIESMSTQ